ncbi:MAG: hypothetical protein HC825_02620 [Oscillatoriales cyanobacterium RM1_1_9]|nr:hypothetical protein [Oscillatoriales cyanobacterium RM1_1_9]
MKNNYFAHETAVIDSGAIIEGEFTITNENGGTQTYYFGTRNIDGMSEKGAPMFEKTRSSDPTRIASWVEPLVESLTLEVNQSGSVPYKIVVPPDADPGVQHGLPNFTVGDFCPTPLI